VGGVTSSATAAVSSTTSTAGGAASGAVNGTVGGVANTAGGLSAQGALTGASHGVIGLQGLALESAASGSAPGSVISSASRNVRLDSGTQMLLQVTGSAQ